jgi:hypothetical protein
MDLKEQKNYFMINTIYMEYSVSQPDISFSLFSGTIEGRRDEKEDPTKKSKNLKKLLAAVLVFFTLSIFIAIP